MAVTTSMAALYAPFCTDRYTTASCFCFLRTFILKQTHMCVCYKEEYYTLLHTKYESSGLCGFREYFFLCFSHCKSMGANDHRGGAIFDPRGMVGRIYKEDHFTLKHTNMKALSLVVSERICFMFFS